MNQVKITIRLIVLLLVVQVGSVSASAANTISGRVTDSSGNPISGILARTETVDPDFTNSLGGSAYTDENGEYSFTIENSVYYLEFVDTNRFNSFATITYFDRWYGDGQQAGYPDREDNREQIVIENNNLSGMDAVMTRGSVFAGTLQFADDIDLSLGEVDQVYVRAYHAPHTPDQWESVSDDRVLTWQGDTTWHINHLPAGTYHICASYYDHDDSRHSLFSCYGGGSLEEAATVEIGAETDLTGFTLTIEPEPAPPYRITGVVYSSTGQPIPNARVEAWPTDGAFGGFHTTADENGAYTLFIESGAYKIRFDGSWHSRLEQEITVGNADLDDVDATLTNPPGITGKVVAEDGQPFLSVEPILYEWITSTENIEGGYWFPIRGGSSDSDSTYNDPAPTTSVTYFIGEPFYTVATQSGTYRVCVWVTYDYDTWERTKRCYGGATAADGTDVAVTSDQLTENIDIPINDVPTGQFTGRVTNTSGEGIGGVSIGISYNHPGSASSRYTTIETAADGTYTADLVPGMYIVNFHDETGEYVDEKYDERIDQTVYIDYVGEVFEPYVEYEPLIITAGERVTINETLMTAAKVTGTVTLSEPETIVGGSARLLREEGDGYYIISTIESIETDGTYSLDGLIGGTYRLCYYVRTTNYENLQCNGHVILAQDSPDVTLAEGERITVDFEMDLDTADRSYRPGEPVPPTEPEVEPLSEDEIVGRLFLPFITQ